MRRITEIIVHCAATKPSMDIGVREIDEWHRARGWMCIGYHYVIRRDGTVQKGRPEDMQGAHCSGHNKNSIGVCLVGGIDDAGQPDDNFTLAQRSALQAVLEDLTSRCPEALIYPHRYFNKAKACPSFDVSTFLRLVGLDGKDGTRQKG